MQFSEMLKIGPSGKLMSKAFPTDSLVMHLCKGKTRLPIKLANTCKTLNRQLAFLMHVIA